MIYTIGLTGGIASGKSTAAACLAALGADIIDADQLAREIVQPGQPAWQDIVDWLGEAILAASGEIDRKQLGDVVFRQPEARKRLEAITHPRIEAAVKQRLQQAAAQGRQIAVVDVPLLFEVGWDSWVDEVWVVYVDAATQLQRLCARNGFTPEEAKARVAAQGSLTEKCRRADVVIDNNGDQETACRQLELAWRQACQIANKRSVSGCATGDSPKKVKTTE